MTMKNYILALILTMSFLSPNVSVAKSLENVQPDPWIQYDIDSRVLPPGIFRGCANLHDAQRVVKIVMEHKLGEEHVPRTCGLVGSINVLEALGIGYQFLIHKELEV
jgi:hypothetical protein